MASTQVKQTEIEFKNANAATGALAFSDDNRFSVDRLIEAPLGIISTGISVSGATSITASTDFDDLTSTTLNLKDASGDKVTFQTPTAITSPYTLTVPSAQGAASTFLKNDGSGNLSWGAASAAVAYGATSTAVGTGTTGQISFSALDGASDNVSLSSNALVVSVAGVYEIICAGGFNGDSNAHYTINLQVYVNSVLQHTATDTKYRGPSPTTVFYYALSASDAVSLNWTKGSNPTNIGLKSANLAVKLIKAA